MNLLTHILSCTVAKIWRIIGRIFSVYRRLSNALEGSGLTPKLDISKFRRDGQTDEQTF